MAKRRVTASKQSRRRGSRKSRQSSGRRRRGAGFKLLTWAFGIALISAAAYTLWLDLQVTREFEGKRWQVPARIYARPLELYPGAPIGPVALEAELRLAGYRPGSEHRPGGYRRRGNQFSINLRRFRYWDGDEPARQVSIRLADGAVAKIRQQRAPIPLLRLEPMLIGRIYPNHGEDRILLRLSEVPPIFVRALLSAEDRGFYRHMGISLRSVMRALWANIRAGQAVQGGSTITQQLAKNFFLTPERSLRRKLNEALIAVLLEFHYQKSEILEAYLNEVYLGQQGRRAVHGFGLAAQYYFGRRLEELEVEEMALLVALVRGPSYYNPRQHPERAKARRDLVLEIMRSQGAIDEEAAKAAKARPLGVMRQPPEGQSPFPAFVDLVRRQLRRDYRDADLRSEGLRIFSTLDPLLQRRAESAMVRGVPGLEARSKALTRGTLQGAVVMTHATSAEVLAVVGGRNPREPGFNRALDAIRPIGSLVKPAVYLAALEQPGRYHLMTPIADAPVRVKDRGGGVWSPQNYDGSVHGSVPLYRALANSYNLATVRLGMELGVDRVIETLKRLGMERGLTAYPSLLLGAVELSPLEVTQIYQTIAGGGFRTPLRAIREVTDAQGRPLSRYPLSVEQPVAAGPAYLLNYALTAVMREGTGRSAYEALPEALSVAGKTGTTDELRDSWFAGYTGEHLAVVWLGRDDNRPTGLSGASGALKVWSALISGIRTASMSPPVPENVLWASVDPESVATGLVAKCSGGLTLPFIRGFGPLPGGCDGGFPAASATPSMSAERN